MGTAVPISIELVRDYYSSAIVMSQDTQDALMRLIDGTGDEAIERFQADMAEVYDHWIALQGRAGDQKKEMTNLLREVDYDRNLDWYLNGVYFPHQLMAKEECILEMYKRSLDYKGEKDLESVVDTFARYDGKNAAYQLAIERNRVRTWMARKGYSDVRAELLSAEVAVECASDSNVENAINRTFIEAGEPTVYELEKRYPPLSDDRDIWHATGSVELGKWATRSRSSKDGGKKGTPLETPTLNSYRERGEKTSDGMFGVDCQGRIWRKKSAEDHFVFYLNPRWERHTVKIEDK